MLNKSQIKLKGQKLQICFTSSNPNVRENNLLEWPLNK